MISTLRFRIAGSIGIVLGAIAIFAGSSVLLALKQPDYQVLRWLVIYNIVAGVVSALVGGAIVGLRPWATRAAVLMTSAHVLVLLILIGLRAAASPVANQSIGAMTFRSTVWLVITLLAWKLGRDAPASSNSSAHAA